MLAQVVFFKNLVNTDDCAHIPGVNLPQQHNVRRRNNYDPQVNDHGKSLLDLCKTCDLRIVNGRTTGDTFGRITYHSPKGISTVDYFIVRHEMLNLINNFIVKEPTIFSDHSQLICWSNLQILASSKTTSHTNVKTFNIPKQFICDQSSFENYRKMTFFCVYQTLRRQTLLLIVKEFIWQQNNSLKL